MTLDQFIRIIEAPETPKIEVPRDINPDDYFCFRGPEELQEVLRQIRESKEQS